MTTDLLTEAVEHHKDRAWLTTNNKALVDAVYQALKRGGDHDASIHTLLHVFPFFTHSTSVKRWHKMNRKGLKLAKRRHTDPATEVIQQMIIITPQKLDSAPPKRKRSERIDPRELFEMYLNLFMENFFTYPTLTTPDQINCLLNLANKINLPYYYYKTYQILALLHNYFGDFDKALDRLHLTFVYWEKQGDTVELALTAYATAMAYKGKEDAELAQYWLEKAVKLFAKTEYVQQKKLAEKELAAIAS
jgi:tetratricopeptide (TPR) repeat protein